MYILNESFEFCTFLLPRPDQRNREILAMSFEFVFCICLLYLSAGSKDQRILRGIGGALATKEMHLNCGEREIQIQQAK